MITIGANFPRLKNNLKLAIIRLKSLEKKKTELAIKMRKEIAGYISNSKIERAKVKVEYVIREDYLVEAMEKVEVYCELVVARFGLIQDTKVIDPGISEAISSIIWAAPRLQSDVPELKVVAEQLTAKYGKSFLKSCLEDSTKTVNEDLMYRLNIHTPSPDMVEKYLIEIARSHSVTYVPSRKPTQDPVQLPDILQNQNEVKASPYGKESFCNERNTCIQSSYSVLPDENQNDTEVLSLLLPPPYSSFDFGMSPASSHQLQLPANHPYFTKMAHCTVLPHASGNSQSVIHSDNKTNDLDLSVFPAVPSMSPTTGSLDQVSFDDITKKLDDLKHTK